MQEAEAAGTSILGAAYDGMALNAAREVFEIIRASLASQRPVNAVFWRQLWEKREKETSTAAESLAISDAANGLRKPPKRN